LGLQILHNVLHCAKVFINTPGSGVFSDISLPGQTFLLVANIFNMPHQIKAQIAVSFPAIHGALII